MAAELFRRKIDVQIAASEGMVPKELFERGLAISTHREIEILTEESSNKWYPLADIKVVTSKGRQELVSLFVARTNLLGVLAIYWPSYWRRHTNLHNDVSVNEDGTPVDRTGKTFHDPEFDEKALLEIFESAVNWFRRRVIKAIARQEGWKGIEEVTIGD